MTEQEAIDLLAAHYAWAVCFRHRKPVLDEKTEENLRSLAKYLTSEDPKFGVMMCGTCGNGKTTLVYALQSAINYLRDRDHFSFLGKDFDVGMRIVDSLEVALFSKDIKSIRMLRERNMLAIDDLGKEPAEIVDYGNVISPVTELMEFRYQHQLFTCITTNLTPDEIKKKYGVRMSDRFNEMLHVIIFDDGSYRR